MRPRLSLLLLSLAACSSAPPPASDRSGEVAALALGPAISTERIRAHISFLASDLTEGRAPGTRGGEITELYLATQARLFGLEPGAAGGSYLQPVPLTGTETLEGSALRLGDATLKLLDDFVATDETLAEKTRFDAPVVFVGYGITSPEFGWDDYAGTDVHGKVVLILANEPGRNDPKLFGGPALTYSGRWTAKYEEATRHGARGAILIHDDAGAGYGWSVVRNSWGRERPYPPAEGHALSAAAWIREDVAKAALKSAGHDLTALRAAAEKRGFRAVDTGIQAAFELNAKSHPIRTNNVLALLRGSDPRRASEVVVFTAHHDHLGITAQENGDSICNGAVDNASGSAALLEIARTFSFLRPVPARSILFAWVTAEEGGLRGSEYYARHPTFPADKIVADLNLDGLMPNGEPAEIEPLGYGRSTLRPFVERIAKMMDLAIVEDRHADQGYFFRSDHFSFARAGVPGIRIGPGLEFRGKPSGWGEAQEAEYRKLRYHRPADQLDPKWDLLCPAAMARFTAALGLALAESDAMPAFVAGDEFARAQPQRRPEGP